ncbi:gephyrin-like molybdotransferase Glp [Geobacter sp. FeAm09]|uniref:molybdopterin molybdotransferase MoeA n=1 Tax=Geobacter sp. FeAm09 TaxID=2597769 RepID=UPI00143CD1EC|nr:gephyrin-like molybdotransferase Glp [Geobacter sp. FeAm09]
MTNYDKARSSILEKINVLEAVEQPLMDCIGQVLAEDVYSEYDLPQVDSSAPDGYAVRSVDIMRASKANPAILQIIETVRAGSLPKKKIRSGTAARIMTGSALPKGADCVVRFEDTDEPADKNGPNSGNPSEVKVYLRVAPGSNIRKAGSTIAKGALVLPKGALIGPAQISALTANGKNRIRVVRRPVIAVISTGDELIAAGRRLSPGKAYDCNSAAIASLISHYGGIPMVLGIARDNEESVSAMMRKGAMADAIITSGGVSKGDYDLIRLVIGKIGELHFSRIKMGPGASFAFGQTHGTLEGGTGGPIPVFALAGPPSGCLINFETLVRPALLKMLGYTKIKHATVKATALDSLPDRKAIAFVKWSKLHDSRGEYRVKLNCSEETGTLASMAMANSLTIIPEGAKVEAGDRIQVLPLDWCLGPVHQD